MTSIIKRYFIGMLIILKFKSSYQGMVTVTADFLDTVTFSEKLSTITAVNVNHCTIQCVQVPSCTSISYNNNTRECSLHPVTFDPNVQGTRSNDWMYYQVYTDKCSKNDGYYENRKWNICYKIYPELVTCIAARSLCSADGARIIQIDSAEKQSYVELLVASDVRLSRVFVGAYRLNTTWYNEDGSVMIYNNWDNGQPNAIIHNEQCVGFGDYSPHFNTAKWHDINEQSHPLSTICEK